ncbi:MAG TPA: shikimate kinase [Longimicrobiales bacterium]|nr:shikimate kinase [Longimicrobiales bacterium]
MTGPSDHAPIRRVVLVGFMAAGKSTVGRLLAQRLGWRFVDFDTEIEASAGRSIERIFAEEGEAAFRALEAELTRHVAEEHDAVLAPGGGWITQPALVRRLRDGSRMVWLRVSAQEAVRRAAADPIVRPLLEADDPLAEARRLLAAREPQYARADWIVDVDGRTPTDVAREISERLEQGGVTHPRLQDERGGA